MDFLLKKIVGLLVQPVAIVLILLIVGLVLLFRRGQSRWSRYLLAGGTLLLLISATPYVPHVIGRALETQFEPYRPEASNPEPAFIVVLGGGASDDPALPLSSRLSPTALARLVEGVRVAQLHPQARLVLSGGSVFSTVAEADLAADVAQMLGIDSVRIVRERRSHDTEDQARLVADVVDRRPFVLVTSAVHMPRSIALFRNRGLEPIPAPTAYLFEAGRALGPRSFLPTAESLREMEMVMHEIYGLIWSSMRGRL